MLLESLNIPYINYNSNWSGYVEKYCGKKAFYVLIFKGICKIDYFWSVTYFAPSDYSDILGVHIWKVIILFQK